MCGVDHDGPGCYAGAMQHAPGFLRLVESARTRVREVSIDEVRAMSQAAEAFHLVDVREQDEWGRGHLPGARHLGKGIIERDIEATIPDRDASIVLYCGGGYRSALAADALREMGYTRVASMWGGWRAWTEAGFPVSRDG
jgi:rhodanese-related sulfurtransferase